MADTRERVHLIGEVINLHAVSLALDLHSDTP